MYYTEIGYNISVYELNDYNKNGEMERVYNRFLEISKLDGIDKYSIHKSKLYGTRYNKLFNRYREKVKVTNVKEAMGEDEVEETDTIAIHSFRR